MVWIIASLWSWAPSMQIKMQDITDQVRKDKWDHRGKMGGLNYLIGCAGVLLPRVAKKYQAAVMTCRAVITPNPLL